MFKVDKREAASRKGVEATRIGRVSLLLVPPERKELVEGAPQVESLTERRPERRPAPAVTKRCHRRTNALWGGQSCRKRRKTVPAPAVTKRCHRRTNALWGGQSCRKRRTGEDKQDNHRSSPLYLQKPKMPLKEGRNLKQHQSPQMEGPKTKKLACRD